MPWPAHLEKVVYRVPLQEPAGRVSPIFRRKSLQLKADCRSEVRLCFWRAQRFNRVDPFFGNIQDPQSLHKFVYVQGDAVNFVDPSGQFTSAFGYAVENAIADLWLQEHPGYVEGTDVFFGRASKIPGIYLAKPDILNFKDWQYNEIKPLTLSGIGEAVAQMSLRAQQFGSLGYQPDKAWHSYPTPLVAGTQQVLFINVEGVLFYTDLLGNAKELVLVTSFAAARGFARNPAAIRTLIGALERIPVYVAARGQGDSARAQGAWAGAFLIAMIGLV